MEELLWKTILTDTLQAHHGIGQVQEKHLTATVTGIAEEEGLYKYK